MLHVTKVYSYFSGWELLQRTATLWEEIRSSLDDITPDLLTEASIIRPLPRVREGRIPVAPGNLSLAFEHRMRERGWTQERIRPRSRGGLSLYLPCLKGRVTARFMVYDRVPAPTFANWLLMDVPRAHDLELADLSVLIVATPSAQVLIDDPRPGRDLFTTDHLEAQLQDLLPVPYAAPFVILGVSPEPSPVFIEQLVADPRLSPNTDEGITKSIEFPPEYYQAGVGILSYFGEILRQKHPDLRAKVRIEQDGYVVRLHIVSSTGDTEIIERTLQQYAMVVSGEALPEDLLHEPWQVVALRNKLEVAQMELRQTQNLLQYAQENYSARMRSIEQEVGFLRQLVGQQLGQVTDAHRLIAEQGQCTERLLLAQISQSGAIIQELIRDAGANAELKRALELIETKLHAGVTPADEEHVKAALVAIQRSSPDAFDKLRAGFVNTMYGVSGNYVFQWIQAVVQAL